MLRQGPIEPRSHETIDRLRGLVGGVVHAMKFKNDRPCGHHALIADDCGLQHAMIGHTDLDRSCLRAICRVLDGVLNPGHTFAFRQTLSVSTQRPAIAMTGPDLLALVRSTDQQIAVLFGQMISITFAMIAAIYYFLNRARLTLKLFAFACYGVGMLA